MPDENYAMERFGIRIQTDDHLESINGIIDVCTKIKQKFEAAPTNGGCKLEIRACSSVGLEQLPYKQ